MAWDEKICAADSCTQVSLMLYQFIQYSMIISCMVKAATSQIKEGDSRLWCMRCCILIIKYQEQKAISKRLVFGQC
jgi:uncharacterized protein YfaT (DUF1175 family)